MAYNLGYVGAAYNLGYTGTYTGGVTYPYQLTAHIASPDPNSILAEANFATTDTPVEFRIISDFDSAKVAFNWQEFSLNQLWGQDINTLSAVTVNAATDTTDSATIGWKLPDGTTGQFTATVNIVAEVVDTTPDPFTVTPLTDQPLNQYVEFAPITVSGIDAGESIAVAVTGTDVQYAVDAGAGYGGYTATSTNVQLGDLVKPRILTPDAFSTAATGSISIGSESSGLSATTRAAVLPTLDTPLPDLSLGQGDAVSVDLNTYFSGASSYALSGFPAGSGLSFSGSVLSGTTNTDDISASPYTLTATAYSADGSIQDAFGVTVVDDVAPVISVFSQTTTNTAPILSGSAGDAVSLTLVVTGVGTYNPVPANGSWTQQLPTVALGEYPITLNGQDAAGNNAVEATGTLSVVNEIVTQGRGLFRPLFVPTGKALFGKLFR